MAEQEVIHPDAHLLFNSEAIENEPDVTAVIMTYLSLKAGLKKWR